MTHHFLGPHLLGPLQRARDQPLLHSLLKTDTSHSLASSPSAELTSSGGALRKAKFNTRDLKSALLEALADFGGGGG
eukprot:CAMPEP_0181291490 /NCGR_PEP_ID=MMETSP1101-20121128/1995_1 /TAXON_ID=46948 /ORGANISM="Rhodomonas abbreviata, Strain Caron Lab Isolate" /LENGTH=76 /DNA_ID=CAMNT_0023395885 /DNA_START=580 /DNA_END=807 /DNA_ORIENTATION=+